MKFLLRLIFIAIVIAVAGYFFVRHQMYSAASPATEVKVIVVPEGATTRSIATLLVEEGVLEKDWPFVAYMRLHAEEVALLKAGTYEIAPGLTIPEIATILARGDGVRRDVSVTFPEGWIIDQMAERLTARGFDGEDFALIAHSPDDSLRARFDFLASLPEGQSLEGYLFPDTYSFLPETTASEIVDVMLTTFDKKFTPEMREHIAQFSYSLHEVVTLASIVEREVHMEKERPVVAGIFYNRLRDGITLGSDATLDYIFGESKIKHTLEETRVDSPYNTYKNAGLPPGPIASPSASALRATVYPEATEYFYFLNNATTGETVFSVTYDEHLRNKDLNGL